MSDEIKRGDTVMVVHPNKCCGNTNAYGYTFKVSEIVVCNSTCDHCGQWAHDGAAAIENAADGFEWQLYRLKKIPPLTELDDITTDEPIKVSA